MDKINREDMLELTRRMTLKRNCFGRVAGGYYDEDGNLEDSFNVHFRNLPIPDQRMLLEIAKSIPFAKTNEQLKEHRFTETEKSSSAWKTMMQLIRCELKNDALLENIYEALGERLAIDQASCLYFFQGIYDIPRKGTDKKEQWESEEVYSFLICALCPINGDYIPDEPVEGFLFPAFSERSGNENRIDMYKRDTVVPGEGLLYLFWD